MRFADFGWALVFSLGALSCRSHRVERAIPPTFSAIQKEIFDESCNAPSCHGSGMKGGLSLLAGDSYRQLDGVPGTVDKKDIPPFLRVKPGSPDSSLLFIKITSPDTGQGEIMPKGSDALSQNQIAAIRQWILNGAPDH